MVESLFRDKVFWTKGMNISLAKYMENKPCIWDPKHPQYTNLGARDEVFAGFATQYNDEFSWQAVKDRWTNIRSTYGFYMRKLLASKAKGQKFKPNWFMWEPCKYLFDVHKFNVDKKKREKQNRKKKQSNVSNEPVEKEEVNSDESCSDYNMGQESNVSCEDLIDNMVTALKGVQNDVFGDGNKYAAIGQAVTKKLSELDSYHAAQLSKKILGVLEAYDENNPMNPNNN